MLIPLQKYLNNYEIKSVTPETFPQIFSVYESNQAFFMLVNGKKATPENSIGDITAIPPNCTTAQKLFVGIWRDDEPIAVLDVITDFPDKQSIWIGLLLIHGDLHGKHIGKKITDALYTSVHDCGYQSIKLGVVENNEKAIAFWTKQGFEYSKKSENIIIMNKLI